MKFSDLIFMTNADLNMLSLHCNKNSKVILVLISKTSTYTCTYSLYKNWRFECKYDKLISFLWYQNLNWIYFQVYIWTSILQVDLVLNNLRSTDRKFILTHRRTSKHARNVDLRIGSIGACMNLLMSPWHTDLQVQQ